MHSDYTAANPPIAKMPLFLLLELADGVCCENTGETNSKSKRRTP
jgi:hypothetical protein